MTIKPREEPFLTPQPIPKPSKGIADALWTVIFMLPFVALSLAVSVWFVMWFLRLTRIIL